MSLFQRLRYALYLAVVSSAAIVLIVAVGSADLVALIPISVFDALFNPLFVLTIYAASFFLAPWVSEHLPITRSDRDVSA